MISFFRKFNLKTEDKILLLGLGLISILDIIINLWLDPDLYLLFGFTGLHFLNAAVLIKKPKSIRQPYKLIGGYYLLLLPVKIFSIEIAPIWILELTLSGLLGIVAIFFFNQQHKKTQTVKNKTIKREDILVAVFLLIFGLFMISNYEYETKFTNLHTELVSGTITKLNPITDNEKQTGWKISLAGKTNSFRINPDIYECCFNMHAFNKKIKKGSQIDIRVIKLSEASLFDRLYLLLSEREVLSLKSDDIIYLDLKRTRETYKRPFLIMSIIGGILILIGVFILFNTSRNT